MVYKYFVRNAMMQATAYRSNTLIKSIGKILYVYVQMCLWTALSHSNHNIDISQTITYVIVTNMIGIFVDVNVIQLINDRIRTGDISLDLMRPFDFRLYAFSYGIGNNIVNIIFQFIPTITFCIIVCHKYISIVGCIPAFIVSMIFATIISFLFYFIIGILAFWLMVTWPINMLLGAVHKLLSGSWIPLWLFPEKARKIVELLPFSQIYYSPVSIIVTNKNADEILKVLLGQVIWIVVLYIVSLIMWKSGTKRLEVQGG